MMEETPGPIYIHHYLNGGIYFPNDMKVNGRGNREATLVGIVMFMVLLFGGGAVLNMMSLDSPDSMRSTIGTLLLAGGLLGIVISIPVYYKRHH